MEEKRHYKLYKSGKNWVVASIAAITVLSGSGLASTALNVHAATPVAAAQSNINFSALKAQLVWSNAKASNASIYSSATGKTLVAKLQADIKTANGYIANPKSTTQAKVTAITTALRNDGVNLNNEVANILNGQLFWSNKKVASDYVTAQGKALFAQLQTQLATANSYVKNPSLATPANVMAITSALHQTGLDLYASKVTDLKAQLVWSNAKKVADYTTEAGKKAFATLTTDIATANGYVADPEFATPDQIAKITAALHQDGLDLIASNAAGDATKLNKDITAVTDAKYVESDYTKDSYAALQTALVAAQKVAGDKTSTQEAIDAADKALTDAQTALVANPVDATALQKLVNGAPTTNATTNANKAGYTYTSVSFAAYQTALKAAQAVLANSKATQSQVAAELAAFKAVLGQDGTSTPVLENVAANSADASQLKLDLASAATTYYAAGASSKYSKDNYAALGSAINAANIMFDAQGLILTNQSQDAVNTADKVLTDAVANLNKQASVNKDSLTQLVTNVSNTLNRTGKAISMDNKDANGNQLYSTDSFAAFVKAYNAAKDILANTSATDAQVTNALTTLDDAIGYKTEVNTGGKVTGYTPSANGLQLFSSKAQLVTDLNLALSKIALVGGFDKTANMTFGGSHIYTTASFENLKSVVNKLVGNNTDTNVVSADTHFATANVVEADLLSGAKDTTIANADKAINDAINGLTPVAAGTLDKTGLQSAIASVKSVIDTNNQTATGKIRFTQLSFNALKTAYNQATSDIASMTVDQKTLDADAQAIANVKLVTATPNANNFDTTALNDAISNAPKNNTSSTYTDDSYKAVADALKVANDDLTAANGTADKAKTLSQAKINADTDTLNAAINALAGTVDKSTLEGKITVAQGVQLDKFSTAAVANLTAALTAAIKVDKNVAASLKDVKGATDALQAAIDGLTSTTKATLSDDAVANFTSANVVFYAASNNSKATAPTKVTYSATSWSAFNTAYTKVLNDFATNVTINATTNPNVTSALKDGVTSAAAIADIASLTAAQNALVTVTGNVADTAQLQADIAKASQYQASDYTSESFTKLTNELTAAKKALADGTAYDVTKLETAMSELVGLGKAALETAVLATQNIQGGSQITVVDSASTVNAQLIVNTYNNALTDAKQVLADKNATQDQITQATKTLNDSIAAVNGLGLSNITTQANIDADAAKASLAAQLKAAASIVKDGQTPVKVELKTADVAEGTPKQNAVDAYNTALTTALGVDSKTPTTAINAAANGLKAAISELTTAGITTSTDLQALGTNLATAKADLKVQTDKAKLIADGATKVKLSQANSSKDAAVAAYNAALTKAAAITGASSVDQIKDATQALSAALAGVDGLNLVADTAA